MFVSNFGEVRNGQRRGFTRLLVALASVCAVIAMGAPPAGAGTGGTPAQQGSGVRYLGQTRTNLGLSTNWYTPNQGTCTHAYPANDFYANNLGGFNGYSFSGSDTTSNCNRVVLYRDAFQGGAGAVNCYRSNVTCLYPDITFYSISWHNS